MSVFAFAEQKLEVLSAEYGTEIKKTDVSGKLRKQISNGYFSPLRNNPRYLRTDPAPREKKTLKIQYRLNGEKKYMEVADNAWFILGEYEPIPLPEGTPVAKTRTPFEIVAALYGNGKKNGM